MQYSNSRHIGWHGIFVVMVLALLTSLSAMAQSSADSLMHDVAINLNGADWSGVRRALAGAGESPFTIVHIGDSHLQADYPTRHLRKNFQSRYGNAGRGIVSPFKLSGSYQPADYTITSPNSWHASRFLRYPWNPQLGFSGTALTTTADEAQITISLRDDTFTDIQMFCHGEATISSVTDADGREISFEAESEPGVWTAVTLSRPVKEATLHFEPDADFVLYTFSLTNSQPGVLYHTIGNGGADIHQYNLIRGFGDGVANLYPDLIILALGTNDSYNHFTPERFMQNLQRMVDDLRTQNPGVTLLLVTPMEIQMSKTVTVSAPTKSRKGKRRTATKKVRSRHVVEGCAEIHTLMLDFARRNNIAIYDWYAATGGPGASARWVSHKLMQPDYVHLTTEGYRRHAEMLFKALNDVLR